MSYSSSSKLYAKCRSTNSTGFETSELTRGLSSTYSRRHYSHRCWSFERCQTLTKFVVIEENNDDGINGHRVLKEADQIIIARRISRTHPRLWREVCRFLSNVTFSCWNDWALLSKAVLVLYNTVYLGSHQLFGKSSQGHSSVDPMTDT